MKARLIKRFEDEIAQLERELTQELPKEIKRAREHGDLRENAEYHAAKERQRFVETRVSMLRHRVAEIQLMNLERIPHDRAAFGSRLTIKRKQPRVRLRTGDARGLGSRSRPRLDCVADRPRARRQGGGRPVKVPTPAGVRVARDPQPRDHPRRSLGLFHFRRWRPQPIRRGSARASCSAARGRPGRITPACSARSPRPASRSTSSRPTAPAC